MDENKKLQKEFINLVWSVYKTQLKEARKWKSGYLTLGEVLYFELNNRHASLTSLDALKRFYMPATELLSLTIAYKFELRRWVKQNLCFISPTNFYYMRPAIDYNKQFNWYSKRINTNNQSNKNGAHTHTKIS